MRAPVTEVSLDVGRDADARVRVENALTVCFAAIRAVHIAQGAICAFGASRSYRRPVLATATLVASMVESTWLVRRWARRRTRGSVETWVETAWGAAGLVSLAVATEPRDRTTSVNWMLPYTVGSAVGAAIGSGRRRDRIAASMILASVYATTVGKDIKTFGAPASTAIANTASYAGFAAVVDVVATVLRRHADELERSRAEAVAQATLLGEAHERDRQHRFLHDSVLQTLEALLKDWNLDDSRIRTRVHHDAIRLRRALRGERPDDDGLRAALASVVLECAEQGLRVELVFETGADDLPPERAAALRDATREALTNVAKHSGCDDAVVRVAPVDRGVEVTVRDHGVGFDPGDAGAGFGLAQSIVARVREMGGDVDLWAQPGRGTRLRMWIPT